MISTEHPYDCVNRCISARNVASGMADLDQVPGALGSMSTFTARIVQSGTASATGAATLYVEYSIPG